MLLPRGENVHHSPGRLRIRIAEKKGDREFFEDLRQQLSDEYSEAEISVNPDTGSLLCLGLDAEDALEERVESLGLFTLKASSRPTPLAHFIKDSFQQANRSVKQSSKGELDIPTLFFLTLAGTGMYQVLRGNVGLPPWYTALWYALGILSKSLADEAAHNLEELD